MSKAAKSEKTGAGPKLPSLPVYELLPPVTVVGDAVDSNSIIFPEWSDQDINSEKWETVKSNPKGPAVSEELKYTDPHRLHLPESLFEQAWKRPEKIYRQSNFVIYKENKKCPDLVSGSTHLLHSEFVRHYISAIGILYYLTDRRPSPIEFTSGTYVPTTEDIPWRPWHHIYSLCKGGKGQKHNPLVNSSGKYVVRLFWMGCWRKLTVDDYLPIRQNCVVIPSLVDPSFTKKMIKEMETKSSQQNIANASKVDVELWPFLLFKALLKIANLSQTKTNELLDFDIIHCLTGWFPYKIEILDINYEDVWEMCSGYSDHYTWADPLSKGSGGGSKGSKSPAVSNFLDEDGSHIAPFHLVGICSDMKLVEEDVVPDVSPCWSHSFLIDQTRNIPLIKPEPLPELAPWKHFRWLDWAIKKGLWRQPDSDTIKCVKIVSDFKKRIENVKCTTPSREALDIQHNVMIVEKLAMKLSEKDVPKQEHHNVDGSIWVDFYKIAPYLSHFYLYFKFSCFKNSTRITNIIQRDDVKVTSNKGKGAKETAHIGSKLLMWHKELLCSRNEPIYIFCDTLDYKLIVINLAQEGNVCVLKSPKHTDEVETVPFSYIALEDYDWRSSKIGDTVISLNTYGNKTLLTEIKPGRFVFRMWLKSDKPFFIHVMSDSEVEIGTLEHILEYMSHESHRLMKFCDEVSSCFGQLVHKMGTASYKEALHLFYRSYLPENNLTKSQLLIVHDIFMQELIKVVKMISHKDELKNRLYALKVLFSNPTIDYVNYDHNNLISKSDTYCIKSSSTETVELAKMKEKAAIVVQAAFRKFYVLKLHRVQNHKNPNHLKIFEILKSIYHDVFSTSHRMRVCANLLRNFLLNNSAISHINEEYAMLKDLRSTIHLQQFVGNVHVVSNTWVPINRYTFYCTSPNSTTIKISLFCTLKKYIVRVFNNNTKQEITRITNNVDVTEYGSNVNGYTVFCYGWPDCNGECKWKLNFATLKTNHASTVIIPDVQIVKNVLKQTYLPNVNNYICRCLIKIENDVILSFRLSTSYKEVELRLCCLNEAGQVFGDISGKSSVILPSVLLHSVASSLDEKSEIGSTVSVMSKGELKSKTRMSSIKHKRYLRSSERMSSDRRASKVSLAGEPSTGEIKKKETTYLIESFVLNNSWPLTSNEWQITEEFKNKKLLYSPDNDTKNFRGSLSGSGSLEKRSNLDFGLPPPYWILEVISNVDDRVLTLHNNRRQEEINEIKRKWYENSPDRYEKSKQLRENYLESHYIKLDELPEQEDTLQNSSTMVLSSSQPIVTRSETPLIETRTLTKPDDPSKTLPPFNLTEYIRETDLKESGDSDHDQKQRVVMNPEVEQKLLNEQNEKIEKFESYHKRYKEDMCNYLNEQTAKYKLLNDFYKNCVEESKDLMTYATSVRSQVIHKIIEDSLAVATDDFF